MSGVTDDQRTLHRAASDHAPPADWSGPRFARWPGIPVLVPVPVACVVAVAIAYWRTWGSLLAGWIDGRGNGFAVAGLCAWLLWRDRRQLRPDGAPSLAALLLVATGVIGWLFSSALSLQAGHQLALLVVLMAWFATVNGVAAARRAAPVAAIFTLAVPIWEVFTRPLQWMTVVVNGLLLRIADLEATIYGDHIAIPFGAFHVADSCSGLNFLMTGVTVGVAYAMLLLREWPLRGTVILVAAAVSIVANWLRVFGLIVIGYLTRMESPLMADHGTYGWVVFAVALVVFFAVARRLEWHAHVRGMAVADAVAASDHSGPVPTRARASSRAAAALAATVVAIAGPAAFGFLSMRQTTSAPPVRIPGVAGDGDWAAAPVSRPGADGSLDAGNAADPDRDSGAVGPRDAGWQPAFQGASERRVSRWMRDGVEVRVDRLIYDVQRQGAELVNSENRIAPDSLLLQAGIVGPLDSAARTVRQAAIRTEEGVRLVWFWYRVAGTDTPSPSRAKLRELLVFGRTAPPSELVAVSTPCGDADCDAATRALYRFVVGRDMPAAPPR